MYQRDNNLIWCGGRDLVTKNTCIIYDFEFFSYSSSASMKFILSIVLALREGMHRNLHLSK